MHFAHENRHDGRDPQREQAFGALGKHPAPKHSDAVSTSDAQTCKKPATRLGKKTLATAVLFCATLAATLNATTAAAAETSTALNLPRLGEPADLVMSPREERALGRRFMRQIREHLPLVNDSELNQYIQSLGRKLLASHPSINATDFNFFIVDNPDINAFAIPGGYIGINAGLIASARNEAQLASVMAHEIAHVTQRHIARLQAAQGNPGLRALATIVAAIVLAQQSTEAGQAALLTGLAASQQSAINFTRSHEYEADRIGIQLLSDAGYDPAAAIDFFEILRRQIALNTVESMEFLRTHPLTTNRISEARNNAARLHNPVAVEDSIEFQLQQMKVLCRRPEIPTPTLEKALINGHLGASDTARLYGRILLLLDAGKADEARGLADELLGRLPNNLTAQLISARVEHERGYTASAERILLSITDLHPDNQTAVKFYLGILAGQQRLERARSVVRAYLRNATQPAPDIYRDYARILKQAGDTSASHEAMADHFFALDEREEGVAQLKLALRSSRANSNDESRIQARLLSTR